MTMNEPVGASWGRSFTRIDSDLKIILIRPFVSFEEILSLSYEFRQFELKIQNSSVRV